MFKKSDFEGPFSESDVPSTNNLQSDDFSSLFNKVLNIGGSHKAEKTEISDKNAKISSKFAKKIATKITTKTKTKTVSTSETKIGPKITGRAERTAVLCRNRVKYTFLPKAERVGREKRVKISTKEMGKSAGHVCGEGELVSNLKGLFEFLKFYAFVESVFIFVCS